MSQERTQRQIYESADTYLWQFLVKYFGKKRWHCLERLIQQRISEHQTSIPTAVFLVRSRQLQGEFLEQLFPTNTYQCFSQKELFCCHLRISNYLANSKELRYTAHLTIQGIFIKTLKWEKNNQNVTYSRVFYDRTKYKMEMTCFLKTNSSNYMIVINIYIIKYSNILLGEGQKSQLFRKSSPGQLHHWLM